MIVKCSRCERSLDIVADLRDGDLITCPDCGHEFPYHTPERVAIPARPKRAATPVPPPPAPDEKSKENRFRVIRQSGPSADMKSGRSTVANMASVPPPVPPHASGRPSRRSNGSGAWIAALLLILIGGGALYWYQTTLSSDVEEDESRIERGGNSDETTHQKEQDERLEKVTAEREAERLKREAERKAKAEARERQLREAREHAEAEQAHRKRMVELEQQLRMGPIVFASDIPRAERPLTAMTNGVLQVIGLEYPVSPEIVELTFSADGVAAKCESLKNGSRVIDAREYLSQVTNGLFVVREMDGTMWLYGTGLNVRTVDVPLEEGIRPMDLELKGLVSVLTAIKHPLPPLKYRLSLKPKKKGEKLELGIFDFDERLTAQKIREALRTRISKKREMNSDSVSKPKLKTFRPKVILYDGDLVKIGMDVTQVPRTYKHRGTKHNGGVKASTYEAGYRRWKEKYDEAIRQEQLMAEVKRENDELMRDYQQRLQKFMNTPITDDEIADEAARYELLIERSRSKLTKNF